MSAYTHVNRQTEYHPTHHSPSALFWTASPGDYCRRIPRGLSRRIAAALCSRLSARWLFLSRRPGSALCGNCDLGRSRQSAGPGVQSRWRPLSRTAARSGENFLRAGRAEKARPPRPSPVGLHRPPTEIKKGRWDTGPSDPALLRTTTLRVRRQSPARRQLPCDLVLVARHHLLSTPKGTRSMRERRPSRH